MLSSSGPTTSQGSRGFVAKVADFGLSKDMAMQSKIQTRNYGTLTHSKSLIIIIVVAVAMALSHYSLRCAKSARARCSNQTE